MSSIALFRDGSYNGINGERVAARKRRSRQKRGDDARTRRLFVGIVLFLSAVLVLEILFHFFVAPRLMISDITIETKGAFELSNEEILDAAGIAKSSYFFSVHSATVEERLESLPMVKSATVSKRFPHALSLRLVKRKAIGLLTIPVEGTLQAALVDEEGVVYGIGEGANTDLHVISGVEIPRVQAGMKLPDILVSFLSDLKNLQQESPTLYRLISEVKFVKNDSTEYEVILFPSHYRIRVRIGPSIDKELLTYIMLVLDVISGRGMEDEVVEVDFRTDHVVYRVEGD